MKNRLKVINKISNIMVFFLHRTIKWCPKIRFSDRVFSILHNSWNIPKYSQRNFLMFLECTKAFSLCVCVSREIAFLI